MDDTCEWTYPGGTRCEDERETEDCRYCYHHNNLVDSMNRFFYAPFLRGR